MRKEYQNMNTPDSLWQVNKKTEDTVVTCKIICEILLVLIGVVLFFLYQWALLPVFYLCVLVFVILCKGILRGIQKAKYEEDLVEAYKEEYDFAKTKVMVSDLRFRGVDERELLRRTICDHEIQSVFLLAAITVLAGFLVYFLMNPNPVVQEVIQDIISTGWGALA